MGVQEDKYYFISFDDEKGENMAGAISHKDSLEEVLKYIKDKNYQIISTESISKRLFFYIKGLGEKTNTIKNVFNKPN